VTSGPSAGRCALKVSGLGVALSSFTLQPISFDVAPGEIVGFLGENGAGKTTTLRLIMGLTRPDRGSAAVGAFHHVLDERGFKARVGFVPEQIYFYAKMRVGALLKFAGGFYDRWDERYCGDLLQRFRLAPTRRIEELSKGMQTKLALVVALAHRPDILLLDEPTAGLDPTSRLALLRLLDEAAHRDGCGVLVSSHDIAEIDRIADRIIIIHAGAIRLDERVIDLRAECRPATAWSLENVFLGAIQ
jgi:ABC-2 type transport system ATP-binding protein